MTEASAEERSQTPEELARHKRKADRSGARTLFFDLWHKRRRHRQFAGVAFVFLITALGSPTVPMLWLGGVLATLGMTTRLWASGFVMKNEVLATSGPYGFVRHPLYVGNLLICAGFCFASGLWWSWPVAVLMLFYYYPHTISYEDAKLRRRFTEEWDRWASRTRALIPRLSPYSASQDGTSWSFRRSLVRNGEPIHIVILGGCLAYLALTRLA
jgi:protein-S-isoprenylcysteine O-methyltransferase Ste14